MHIYDIILLRGYGDVIIVLVIIHPALVDPDDMII